jgi:hypothetical protein
MTQINNPLRKYFRQPVIHLKLPSGGNFYPNGALILPPNGEVPILPMTAIDEITTRTPDALFNGSAVIDIIGSCVPSIRDPWAIPSIDLNALLVAVRMASYGHEMEIGSTCPNCGHSHNLNIDLRIVLDNIQLADYSASVRHGDLEFFFAPLNYQQINDLGRTQYEDQKIMQMVNDSTLSEEEKLKRLGESFKRITRLTIESIAASVSTVKTGDLLVTEREHILDFLLNCPKDVFELIKDHALKLRSASDLMPVNMICEECKHEYKQDFTLDMSNFFVAAS